MQPVITNQHRNWVTRVCAPQQPVRYYTYITYYYTLLFIINYRAYNTQAIRLFFYHRNVHVNARSTLFCKGGGGIPTPLAVVWCGVKL